MARAAGGQWRECTGSPQAQPSTDLMSSTASHNMVLVPVAPGSLLVKQNLHQGLPLQLSCPAYPLPGDGLLGHSPRKLSVLLSLITDLVLARGHTALLPGSEEQPVSVSWLRVCMYVLLNFPFNKGNLTLNTMEGTGKNSLEKPGNC